MEFCRHASKLVRGHSWPSSTIRAVAEGEFRRHRSQTGATSPWPWQDVAPTGRWKRGGVGARPADSPSTKVRSLEAALAALGPEESVAKTEIAGALKRVREQEVASVRVDPDAKVVAAREKVARLEQAIAAMGDFKGPEMDTLVTALKHAQKDAQEQPLDAQIRAREAFIELSRMRIAHYDEERAAEISRLEESEKRLEELRAMQRAQPLPSTPVADASTEVARLQQMVMELQKQLHQGQHAIGSLAVVSPFRIRKREDYVPATEQEVMEWMTDRQEDMNAALLSGNPSEAARISGLITEATKSLQPVVVSPSMVTNVAR